jgi:general secretion pathway protein J
MSSFLNKRGFTLIEILIATAILSVVLAAIYSTFFLSHKAMEGMDESMLKIQETRKAIDILRRELDSVYFDSGDKYTSFKIVDRDIYGKQATQLTFTTFSTLRPSLSRISYYIEEQDKKLILFKKIGSPYSDKETDGVDIIEDIEAFTVEAIYNDNWVKTWDTEIIQGLPEKLRISITIKIKGRDITLSDISSPKVEKTV